VITRAFPNTPAVHRSISDGFALMEVTCVEINQCVGCRQFFTKSFLGDDAAVLAPSSRRCVDGVEVDVTIQDERAVNF
jgi:hypothetical protein